MICRDALDDAQQAQCINYLKASGMQICLLLDFGKTAPGDQARGARPVNCTDPSACIRVHPLPSSAVDSFFLVCRATSPQRGPMLGAIAAS